MLNIDLNVVFNIINIIVLFLLLKKFLFRPVTEIMEKRQSIIEASLNDARDSKTQAEKLKTQYEDALKDAREEASNIVKDAKTRANAEYDKKMQDAKNDANALLAKAEKTIALEREKAIKSAGNDIASLAIMAASKVIEKETDAESDNKILDEFLSQAGNIK